MMGKKMKRVAFDSSPLVLDEDARGRFKHQSLLQDYLELQQETESAKNKLMALKQKKLTLQAEVRFLRRRYKFLSKTKSLNPPQQVTVKPETCIGKSKKEKVSSKKEATLCNLPSIHKGRVYTEKKNALGGAPYPVFDFDPGVKEQSRQRAAQASNSNPRVRSDGVKEILRNNVYPLSDLNQKESVLIGKEGIFQSRAPMIDLNQISREEEEMQESYEHVEEQTEGLIRNGVDEQNADMKLSICRNVGDASTSRPGKRKISWQDPVALRV